MDEAQVFEDEYERGRKEGIDDAMDAIEQHDLLLTEEQRRVLCEYIRKVLLRSNVKITRLAEGESGVAQRSES